MSQTSCFTCQSVRCHDSLRPSVAPGLAHARPATARPAGRQTAPQPSKGDFLKQCMIRRFFKEEYSQGPVPLCEDDTWKSSSNGGLRRQPTRVLSHCAKMIRGTPRTLNSSHSGLMRQPTKEESVSKVLEPILRQFS